jgi:hypothetical protein
MDPARCLPMGPPTRPASSRAPQEHADDAPDRGRRPNQAMARGRGLPCGQVTAAPGEPRSPSIEGSATLSCWTTTTVELFASYSPVSTQTSGLLWIPMDFSGLGGAVIKTVRSRGGQQVCARSGLIERRGRDSNPRSA